MLKGLNNLMMSDLCATSTLRLAGGWNVQLQEKGQRYWDAARGGYPVVLPGSLTSNGIGHPISLDTPWSGQVTSDWATLDRYAPYRQPDNVKVPFWLQPDAYYSGPAWYRREVEIPAHWAEKHLMVNLERCHWKTTLYVDDVEIGACLSLSVPHRYDVSAQLTPGKHVLTICVDNGYHVRIGTSASALTDHTQTNWNGIVGDLSIYASDAVWIDDVQAYPDLRHACMRVAVKIGHVGERLPEGMLSLQAVGKGSKGLHQPEPISCTCTGASVEMVLPLRDDMLLWDEFDPALYTLTVELTTNTADGECHDRKAIVCGMREISTKGRSIQLNHRPVMFRGTIDCASFPLTGYPTTDVAEWLRILGVIKAYGLNHVRFHSWCPPEAAFVAADRLGVYLQVEGPVWRGWCEHKEAAPVEPYLIEECERILHAYGNHPSFVLFASGNEPWELDHDWLAHTWVPHMKALDPRRLVCAAAHFPLADTNDFHLPGGMHAAFHYRYHQKFDVPPATTRNYEDQIAQESVPCISHEPGQWCVFPNLKEMAKYTGCLKARNFEIVRDFLDQNHLLEQAEAFLWASGRFQTGIYKECYEAFLRTRGCAGYQMLGLNDFPGQGTALVGAVDVFWEDKGYTCAAEYRRFTGPVVPLAIMQKRTWTNDEQFRAVIRMSNYAQGPLEHSRVVWTLADDRATVAEGSFPIQTIPVGNEHDIGDIVVDLGCITKASKLNLRVDLPDAGYANDWNIWVYPAASERIEDLLGDTVIATTAKSALDALNAGRNVLLAPGPKGFCFDTAATFAPIFWNKPWFPGQAEHTTGLLIQREHPMFEDFPTDIHADWQWWDIMVHARPMVLDALDPALRSPIQPIDDWNRCRRLGLVIEARVGSGRLVLTSLDITEDLDLRPVTRQFLKGLLRYMHSEVFRPQCQMTEQQLVKLVPENPLEGLVPTVTASSVRKGFPAANLLDLNPAVFWHSKMRGEGTGYPHEIILSFDKPVDISGFNILPRQDGNHEAMVKTVAIHASDDGQTWSEPLVLADLTNNQEWKQVLFPQPAKAKAFRIVCLASQNPDDNWASFAQLAPIRSASAR